MMDIVERLRFWLDRPNDAPEPMGLVEDALAEIEKLRRDLAGLTKFVGAIAADDPDVLQVLLERLAEPDQAEDNNEGGE